MMQAESKLIFRRTLPHMPTTREYDFAVGDNIVGFLQLRQVPSTAENCLTEPNAPRE